MNEIKITNKNGVLTVSSLQVAKDFGKRHDHIIRDIENLIDSFSENPILGFQKSDENSSNLTPQNLGVKNFFIENTYKTKGNNKTYKCYDITRDGFSLLVMGFTGKKALEWKIKYIEAFNSMERQLININSDIERIVNKVISEKIETIISKVIDEKTELIIKVLDERIELIIDKALDKKFKVFAKAMDKKFRIFAKETEKNSKRIIIESVSETAKALVTYFDVLIKILNNLY
ncbi:MAG: Rha family transcriptional regulator [Ruminococcus sp.]|nr:Rha family transcriptional regulator [Ruminococcus sp.]